MFSAINAEISISFNSLKRSMQEKEHICESGLVSDTHNSTKNIIVLH